MDVAEGVCVVVMFVIAVVVLYSIEEFVLYVDMVTFTVAFDEIVTEAIPVVEEVVTDVIWDGFVWGVVVVSFARVVVDDIVDENLADDDNEVDFDDVECLVLAIGFKYDVMFFVEGIGVLDSVLYFRGAERGVLDVDKSSEVNIGDEVVDDDL